MKMLEYKVGDENLTSVEEFHSVLTTLFKD